jgi:hypothetical protein
LALTAATPMPRIETARAASGRRIECFIVVLLTLR